MECLVDKAGHEGLDLTAAQDLANDAFVHFFKNEAARWDPEADPTAYRALLYIMDWKLSGLRRRERSRQEKRPIVLDSDAVDETPPESERNPERQILTDEWVARRMRKLRAGLAGSSLTLAMVDLFEEEGLLAPAQVAERLGVDVKAVYTAEAQLRRHIKRIHEEGSDPEIAPRAARSAAQ
jgi:DNA-directed RNA polymerase specialized sigma24 family protein